MEIRLIETILMAFIWLLGACIFSFLNVVIYRVPRKISFVRGFSHCPDCGHQLSGLDMIPVFSWLALRGHCRYCKCSVSPRYTWVELFGGCMALLCVFKIGYNLAALTVFAFLGMLTVVAFVDIDTMEIPDGFVLAILIIGVVSIVTMPGISLAERLIGVFAVSLPLLLITLAVPGAFGGGDIKLMGACGLLLGWKLSLVSLFLAVLTGGLYGIYLLAAKKKGRKEHFAFGPFLCAGMCLALFWGTSLTRWYLGLCGLK
ncbi:MAG: prepilin peptidase [Lachnospiraceae bacterium]|nr:prepilin peptidase [Lachnospiraceae bacterium]